MDRVQVMAARAIGPFARQNDRALSNLPRIGIVIKAPAPLTRMVDAEGENEPVKIRLKGHWL
jgi:hypothetical protein